MGTGHKVLDVVYKLEVLKDSINSQIDQAIALIEELCLGEPATQEEIEESNRQIEINIKTKFV